MAAKSNDYRVDLINLIFNNTPMDNNIASSGTATKLYVALHTGDPGVTGNQSTNEVTYTTYVRYETDRASGSWTVSGFSVSPTVDIEFETATDGSETATYASVGTSVSGSTDILYYGLLDPSISISNGVTPIITTSATITET